MAHLWVFGPAQGWTPQSLAGDAAEAVAGVLLRRLVDPPNTWALITRQPNARLNGLPVPLGLAVLEDKDEIRVPGLTAWFSTEAQALVEQYPELAVRGCCPRCKQGIDVATPAVRCPACNLWHHASDDLPCWTYAPTCAACAQETALDAGFRWSPEEL